MKKKQIGALLLAAVLSVTLLAACGTAGSKKQLIMATEPTFPPYEYMDGDKVVGIDVDIAQEVAKDMGMELKVEVMNFDAVIPSVKSGKADFGASGISVTEERKLEVDFTVEYATSVQVILTKSTAGINTVEDLNGKKVGVQLGTISDLVIQDEHPEIELVANKSYTNLALDLENGKIDAIVLDNLPAQAIAAQYSDFVIADTPFLEDAYAFVVKKENPELLASINKTLERLMAEGKIAEYTITHLGQ